MDFKSYYKTQPKEPLQLPPPAEPKRPVQALPRAPSIKINTKGSGTPRPSVSSAPDSQSINATPLPRQLSSSFPKSAGAADTPISSAKRPRPDSEERGSVAKRPKTETPSRPNGTAGRKRKMITLKTPNPKRLALILGQTPPSPGSAARRSLPGAPGPKLEASPEGDNGIQDSIVAKPVRKPLPSGDAVRKPLPKGGSSMSPPPPPPPKMTVNTSVSSSARQAGSPQPATPGSATGRPKIKIVRKSQSGPSQSPPAP